MPAPLRNVLFLCTGNSARSIIAETLLNVAGGTRFRAFSAGSKPAGAVNPHVAEYLARQGFDVSNARSKSWDEFAGDNAPSMDIIITVCGSAAGETCPFWPGHPATAHWGVEDPAHIADPQERERAIAEAARILGLRIALLLTLPLDSMDLQDREIRLRQIGTVT